MKSEQLGYQLINTTTLDIQIEQKEESAFISRYNQVINCCNRNAEEGQPQMQVMVGNQFINKISHILSKPIYYLLFIVIFVVPLLNLTFLITLLQYFLYIRKENLKHKRNIERVKDPFINFYFLPDMCQQMGKHYVSLNLQPNQLAGFIFNEQLRTRLAQRVKDKQGGENEKLTVIIYDQYFYDSFHLYRKQYYKTIICLCLGIGLIITSTLFYLNIFGIL